MAQQTMKARKALVIAIAAVKTQQQRVAFDANLLKKYQIEESYTVRAAKEYEECATLVASAQALEILHTLAEKSEQILTATVVDPAPPG